MEAHSQIQRMQDSLLKTQTKKKRPKKIRCKELKNHQ